MTSPPLHPAHRITSTVVNGNTDGGISIALGIVIILLNATEAAVLGRNRRNRKRPEYMILSLCCADLLVGIAYAVFGILKIILSNNPNSSTKKSISNQTKMVVKFSLFGSILHLLVIALERLYAARCPLKYRTVTTKKIMLIMIIGIWICSVTITILVSQPNILDTRAARSVLMFKGWFIFIVSATMVCVYGYLAYFLSHRFKTSFTVVNCENQTTIKKYWYHEKRKETIFCLSTAVAFFLCSSLSAVGWLLPNQIDLVCTIGEYLLVSNSSINPILYFWKTHISRKGKMPKQPIEAIRWAFRTESGSRTCTPKASYSGSGIQASGSRSHCTRVSFSLLSTKHTTDAPLTIPLKFSDTSFETLKPMERYQT